MLAFSKKIASDHVLVTNGLEQTGWNTGFNIINALKGMVIVLHGHESLADCNDWRCIKSFNDGDLIIVVYSWTESNVYSERPIIVTK